MQTGLVLCYEALEEVWHCVPDEFRPALLWRLLRSHLLDGGAPGSAPSPASLLLLTLLLEDLPTLPTSSEAALRAATCAAESPRVVQDLLAALSPELGLRLLQSLLSEESSAASVAALTGPVLGRVLEGVSSQQGAGLLRALLLLGRPSAAAAAAALEALASMPRPAAEAALATLLRREQAWPVLLLLRGVGGRRWPLAIDRVWPSLLLLGTSAVAAAWPEGTSTAADV